MRKLLYINSKFRIGLTVKFSSLWLGYYWNNELKKLCITLIPFVTIWIEKQEKQLSPTPKTIKQWFTEWGNEKALNNLDPDWAEYETDSLSEAIRLGFYWTFTEEGEGYWEKEWHKAGKENN